MGGSEKAIFSAPNFKRMGSEYDDRMKKIISMILVLVCAFGTVLMT